MSKQRNAGALVGGALLLALGIISLLGQVFHRFNFWSAFWPLIILAFGAMFYVGMFAGGKSLSGLAVPATIISTIGLILFYQNWSGHWESWSYAWTLILFSVGLSIYIMGRYGEDEDQRRSGQTVMRVGAIMFVLFGGFFELIFSAGHKFGIRNLFFPAALILLGIYIIYNQMKPKKLDSDIPVEDLSENKS